MGRLSPDQGMHVAHAAPAFLQIRLEQEGRLAGFGVPGVDVGSQRGQPSLGPLLPGHGRRGGELIRQRLVAGEVAGAQQGGGRVQVIGGQGQRLF